MKDVIRIIFLIILCLLSNNVKAETSDLNGIHLSILPSPPSIEEMEKSYQNFSKERKEVIKKQRLDFKKRKEIFKECKEGEDFNSALSCKIKYAGYKCKYKVYRAKTKNELILPNGFTTNIYDDLVIILDKKNSIVCP